MPQPIPVNTNAPQRGSPASARRLNIQVAAKISTQALVSPVRKRSTNQSQRLSVKPIARVPSVTPTRPARIARWVAEVIAIASADPAR